jgi:hypothetical protein
MGALRERSGEEARRGVLICELPLPSEVLAKLYFHLKNATEILLTTCAFMHHMHAMVPARMFESSSLFQ